MKTQELLGVVRKEFLYGGHIFAAGAAGVVLSTALIGGFKPDAEFLVLIYLIYYIIYLNDHVAGAEQDAINNPVRSAYLKDKARRGTLLMAGAAFLSGYLIMEKGSLFVAAASLLTLILGVLYGRCFKGITKSVTAFKNYFVAAFWGIIVIYAAVCHGAPISAAVLVFSLYTFLRMLAIQAFFDVRDIKGDAEEKLKTYPVVWGVPKTLRFISVLNGFSVFLILVSTLKGYVPAAYLILILSVAYGASYIERYRRGDQSAYLWAAGEFLFWTMLVLIANVLI